MAPADQPVHFLDRVYRSANGAVAVSVVLEVRLEDWFQHELGGGLYHPIPIVGMPSGRSPPSGFGIDTRRTGSARYVFETSSSRRPASHLSKPDDSIRAKVIPSLPGAPAFARANA